MKKIISLKTPVAEVLSILNEAVSDMAGKKFSAGMGTYHDMVQRAIENISFPKGVEVSTWKISYNDDLLPNFGIFAYCPLWGM
jgi:hypothetical protein